jgi:hypothetical protein
MADYVLPGVVEKRVRYFDGQFLQDQDFIDEQNYQLDREHRHNRLLHGPGIADGLTVTSTAPNQVTVAPGTAIDSDGHQLELAQATTVDLPAADFNDKQGVQLYISYLESAEDPQAVGGSQDFTRWLERPQLTAVAPGHDYAGTTPPVLLASLALDNAGRVAVDGTVRSFAGVRLPGAAADAVTLRATSGGPVDLAGSLAIENRVGIGNPSPAFPLHLAVGKALRIEGGASSSDSAPYFSFGGNGAFGIDAPGVPSGRFVVQNSGHVGIGTANPGNDLEVGAFDDVDRFLAFKVQGGNKHRSGIKLWAWKDNNGFSIQYDERNQTGNGLHIKTHNQDPDGTSQLFVGWGGNLGIGTTTPGAKLEVAGGGGTAVDLLVNGRLRSNNNDGGLWVAQDRFVGGLDTNKIGFYSNNAWRLAVLNNGYVGIGTTTPGNDLEIGAFDDVDRFLALKVQGGNKHRAGIKLFTWKDNNGFSIQYDERIATGDGLHIKTHNQNADGTTQLFVGWGGNVAIGTTTPAARFSVVAPGVTEIAGTAHSAVQRTSAGALAQAPNSEVALSSTGFSAGSNQVALGVRAIRTANGTDWYTTAIGLGMDVDNTVRAGASLFLHSNHNVGIGTTTPGNDLEIGAFDNQDRFLAFKVQGGNAHRSGIKLWTFKDNYGYSIQYDERVQPGNGLHIKTHNQNADGTTQLFVAWNGNIGLGTTDPGTQKLSVVGSTYLQGDLFVGGRMIYTSGGNSWWQLYPRQSGLDPTWWTANNGVGGPSDVRLKTGLRPIRHALDLVRKLQGVRYQWGDEGLARFTRDIEDTVLAGPGATDEENHSRQQAERQRALQSLSGDRMGMVAQDVEAIAPELVYADDDGYRHIRYQHLTALLTEAIKEQDAVVQALAATVASLQAKQ